LAAPAGVKANRKYFFDWLGFQNRVLKTEGLKAKDTLSQYHFS